MLQYNPSISGSLNITGSLIISNGMIGTVNGVDVQIFSSSISQVVTNIQAATGSQEGRLGSIESFTSSTSARLNSIETTSASVDTLNTAQNSRLSALETTSASVDILNTNQNTRLTGLEIKTGSLATTGSNTFIGTQTITGSLFISSNLIVQGSSSLQNITASAVSIGANIINLNTANPAIRFAGLVIGDSGSVGGSGSFLYDSVQDEMIFVHRGSSTVVTSSVTLMGPETYNNLGNETYPTANRIQKGRGNEHLGDSNITDTGTIIRLSTDAEITGSLTLTNGIVVPNSKIKIGAYIGTTGDDSIAIGYGPAAAGSSTIAIGYNPLTNHPITFTPSNNSIAIGYNPKAGGNNSIAIGYTAKTFFPNSINIGDAYYASGSTAWVTGSFGIGISNPNNLLHLYGTDGNSYLRWTSDVATTGTRIGYNGSEFRIDQQQNADITFRTNGCERVRITCTGNLSVGNTNDSFKLDVSGTGRFKRTNGDSRVIIEQTNTSAPYTATLELSSQGIGTYGGTIQYDAGPENLTIENYGRSANGTTQGDINFRTKVSNTTPTNILNLDGFTGAATFSSSVTALSLDVISASGVGSSTVSGLARFITAGTTTAISVGQANSARRLDLSSQSIKVTGDDFFIVNASANATVFENNGAERMRIDSGGTVQVRSGNELRVYRSDNARYGTFYTDNNYVHIATSTDPLRISSIERTEFYVTGVERMRITSGGGVIIGNTTAHGGLTISDFTSNDGNDSLAFFYRGTSGNHESLIKFHDFRGQLNAAIGNNLEDDGTGTHKARLVFKTSNSGAPTERMRIASNGDITYGVTAAYDTNLIWRSNFTGTVFGRIFATGSPRVVIIAGESNGVELTSGATSFTSNSDERLKDINCEIENAVEKLLTLRTVHFSWKADKLKKENLGLIAQDVEKQFPQLIDKAELAIIGEGEQKDETEYLGIRYTELIPVLVKAIQEQQSQIEILKAEIQTLKQ